MWDNHNVYFTNQAKKWTGVKVDVKWEVAEPSWKDYITRRPRKGDDQVSGAEDEEEGMQRALMMRVIVCDEARSQDWLSEDSGTSYISFIRGHHDMTVSWDDKYLPAIDARSPYSSYSLQGTSGNVLQS